MSPSATFRTYDLGDAGRGRIREVLSRKVSDRGADTLSGLVLTHVPLNLGEASTYLPDDVAPQTLLKFEQGGKISIDPNGTRYEPNGSGGVARWETVQSAEFYLIDLAEKYLSSEEERFIFVEHPYATPTDGWIKKEPLPHLLLFHKSNVLEVLIAGASRHRFELAVQEATQAGAIGGMVFARCPGLHIPETLGELSLGQLELVARGAEMVAVGAYDAEGFVLWKQ